MPPRATAECRLRPKIQDTTPQRVRSVGANSRQCRVFLQTRHSRRRPPRLADEATRRPSASGSALRRQANVEGPARRRAVQDRARLVTTLIRRLVRAGPASGFSQRADRHSVTALSCRHGMKVAGPGRAPANNPSGAFHQPTLAGCCSAVISEAVQTDPEQANREQTHG